MTDQQSTHAATSGAVVTYYSKKALEDFEPKTIWYNNAPEYVDIPTSGGKTISFNRYRKIVPLTSDDTDEFTAQQMYFSAQEVTATVHERDGYVQLSRFACLVTRNNLLDSAAKKVQKAAAKTLDLLVRNDIGMMIADVAAASSLDYGNMKIDDASNTLNSTGITARVWSHDQAAAGDRFPVYHNKTRLAQSATVVSFAKTALSVLTINHAINTLEQKDVGPLSDGFYRCIAHPGAVYQITTSTAYKGWLSPTSSSDMKNMPSQVGVISGCRIMSSTLGLRFPLSGDTLSTSSGAIFASLIYGDEAWGVTEITGKGGGRKGFEFFLKQSGPTTVSDPTNKKKQAAFSITAVAKVLNKSAGLWVLSTEQI